MLKNHKKSIYSPPESNSFGWQILGTLASNRQIGRHTSTNNKEGGNNMNLNWFKHHTCPEDEEEATLLVAPETETIPETATARNLSRSFSQSASHWLGFVVPMFQAAGTRTNSTGTLPIIFNVI